MAFADILDGRIVVQTEWNENELVKQVPGALWNQKLKVWTVPITWTACVQLRGVFQDRLHVGTALTWWSLGEFDNRVQAAVAQRNALERDEGDPRLYPFQRAGVHWLTNAGSALLGDEMGGGKTIQILATLRDMKPEDVLPALIICPNSVKFHWETEAHIWFPYAQTYVAYGSSTQRKKILDQAAHDPNALIIINIEALRLWTRLSGFGSQRLRKCIECDKHDGDASLTAAKCEVHPKTLNKIPIQTVVFDEAHRIKEPNAKQTRAAWAVGHQRSVKLRFALTGTPIANDPSDLWSVMHFIAPDEYPVKGSFVDRYALLSWGKYGGLEVKGLRPDTREEFYKFFDARFRCMPKALVLPQLPDKVYSTRVVELSPKQLKAYRAMEENLVTRLPDGSLMVAPNQLEERLRLMQFASATMTEVGVNPKNGKPMFEMCDPSSKIDELEEFLEDFGERPVAVAAEHRQLINLAAARLTKLKISFGLYTGAVREFERQVALRDFQAGKLRVFLFTMKAGGTGITLTATDTLVRLQRADSMIDNLQTVDRVHRIGSERHESIHIVDFIAHDTVEDKQVENLNEKAKRLEEITRAKALILSKPQNASPEVTQKLMQLEYAEQQIMNGDTWSEL